jgi:hypothetical protein
MRRNQVVEAGWDVVVELLPVAKVGNPSCVFGICEWPTTFVEALTGGIAVRVHFPIGYME